MANNTLIIVSTRLPVKVSKDSNGTLVYSQSDGGLATGMSAVSKSRDSVWIGWPGIANEELTKRDKEAITLELKKRGCHPVFLNQQQVDEYYSGYCNATIWPLFHYFSNMTIYEKSYWQSYREVNDIFAKAVKAFVSSDSQIWVHDYQLMLVPKLLRDRGTKAMIGFFLHIPFPSFEIFRLLPERSEILEGLLGADLVGFHTYDYVRHFLSSVKRIVGYDASLGSIRVGERVVKTDAFPIGIDYKRFAKSSRLRSIKKEIRSFTVAKEKTKVILAVDRADYSKGIPARLDAYEAFLKKYSQYHEKVVMILLASPSREDVTAYQELKELIDQKIGKINGAFSTVNWSPITYFHKSLPQDEVAALYTMADVMLVTPLRDGMNLVAKEFIATKHKKGGALVLSEMAGVATELPEAILVNPNNTDMVAEGIHQALTMPETEQKQRMKAMQARISTYTIHRWAEDFIHELHRTKERSLSHPRLMNNNDKKNLQNEYNKANKRLILLDYDGVLKSFVSSPSKTLARPSAKVKRIIKKMTDDKKNHVMIISGRPKSVLESFFENKGLGLVAEHGGWIFSAGTWVKHSVNAKKWKKPAMNLLRQFVDRTPGSSLEEKDFSLVWHFRNVSPDLAFVRKEELKMELRTLLSESDIAIFEGNKIIEVKPKNMHKGAIVSELMTQDKWDFIMAIGDDYTDEDMFRVLPERAHSIHVGREETIARYTIEDVDSVIDLLKSLP